MLIACRNLLADLFIFAALLFGAVAAFFTAFNRFFCTLSAEARKVEVKDAPILNINHTTNQERFR